jgi:hypothetical protein
MVGEERGILVLLCVSVPAFMIGIDSNIVAVSLPSIAHSLRADFSAIERVRRWPARTSVFAFGR